MFTEIAPLLKERAVTIVTAYRDGKVHLMVSPRQTKPDENPAYYTPFRATGTPEELDAQLPEYLRSYVTLRQEITQSLEASVKESEARMKAAADEAKQKMAERTAKKPAVTVSKPSIAIATKAVDAKEDSDIDDDNLTGAVGKTEQAAPAVAATSPQVTLF